MKWYVDPANFWFITCFIALPIIWAFLLLHTPHDCFRCTGKDPDRIFSIHQYNRLDRAAIKVKQKYGKRHSAILDMNDIEAIKEEHIDF